MTRARRPGRGARARESPHRDRRRPSATATSFSRTARDLRPRWPEVASRYVCTLSRRRSWPFFVFWKIFYLFYFSAFIPLLVLDKETRADKHQRRVSTCKFNLARLNDWIHSMIIPSRHELKNITKSLWDVVIKFFALKKLLCISGAVIPGVRRRGGDQIPKIMSCEGRPIFNKIFFF